MLEVAPSAEWTQQKASHVILGWGGARLMRPMKLQRSRGLVLLKYRVTASFVPVGLSLYGPCRASGSPLTALEVFVLNQMYYSPLGTAAWWRKLFISFLLLLFLLSVILSGTCCELLMQILQQWRTEISASCSRNISGCCLQPSSWSPPEVWGVYNKKLQFQNFQWMLYCPWFSLPAGLPLKFASRGQLGACSWIKNNGMRLCAANMKTTKAYCAITKETIFSEELFWLF